MATLTHRQPLPRVRASPFRLPILDGYMLREMFGPFLFAFGAFLLFWALNIFFLAADYIINQHAPFFLVAALRHLPHAASHPDGVSVRAASSPRCWRWGA